MRHVELGSQRGVELVNVATVPHNALAVSDVEVSRHLIHQHLPADRAALVGAQVRKVLGAVVNALRGVAQDVGDAPLLALVGLDEVIAGVAAAHVGAVSAVAVAAVIRGQVLHLKGPLSTHHNHNTISLVKLRVSYLPYLS